MLNIIIQLRPDHKLKLQLQASACWDRAISARLQEERRGEGCLLLVAWILGGGIYSDNRTGLFSASCSNLKGHIKSSLRGEGAGGGVVGWGQSYPMRIRIAYLPAVEHNLICRPLLQGRLIACATQ